MVTIACRNFGRLSFAQACRIAVAEPTENTIGTCSAELGGRLCDTRAASLIFRRATNSAMMPLAGKIYRNAEMNGARVPKPSDEGNAIVAIYPGVKPILIPD
ncbi:hypothetical protein AFIC_000647 [[Pseudomonas] carboxydohydrogena]|uniref:Uncharacterized protein n=1 Tax=Afipia carboxydohydrogena TaxID=290 RepID=A0ABY8BQA6_AFICR|nr:hypothetical protein [[Pseudomonas] carboxydohydrogena]WEF52178.1 hypothetical protein AFIC_000647 [[Pseudomonas] carboxydohydrogena]